MKKSTVSRIIPVLSTAIKEAVYLVLRRSASIGKLTMYTVGRAARQALNSLPVGSMLVKELLKPLSRALGFSWI